MEVSKNERTVGGCPNCAGVVQTGIVEQIPAWVRGETVTCVNCGEPIDVWKELVVQAKGHSFFRLVLVARTTAFRFEVPPTETGRFFKLDLVPYGVTEGATVYNVAITPEYAGPEFVTIVEGTQQQVPYPNQRTVLYLGAWPSGINLSRVAMSVMVSWSEPGAVTFPWARVLEGFTHVAANRLAEGLLAANVAVEYTVTTLLEGQLPAYVGAGASKDFFDNATYSQLLGVVLPMWCQLAGQPPLPTAVAGHLKHLRKVRNDIAHGNASPQLNDTTVAELLAATVVATAYFESL